MRTNRGGERLCVRTTSHLYRIGPAVKGTASRRDSRRGASALGLGDDKPGGR